MSKRQVRYEAGGDPTQGPVDELAAVPPLPSELNDFPDGPEQTDTGPTDRDDAERDQDQPDLDRFAERLGLRDTDDADTDDADIDDDDTDEHDADDRETGDRDAGDAVDHHDGQDADQGTAVESDRRRVETNEPAATSMTSGDTDAEGIERRPARWLVVTSVRNVTARTVGTTGAGFRTIATALERVAIRIRDGRTDEGLTRQDRDSPRSDTRTR